MAKNAKITEEFTEKEIAEAMADLKALGVVKETVGKDGKISVSLDEAALKKLQKTTKGK